MEDPARTTGDALGLAAAAEHLGVSPAVLRGLLSRGVLASYGTGDAERVRLDDLEEHRAQRWSSRGRP